MRFQLIALSLGLAGAVLLASPARSQGRRGAGFAAGRGGTNVSGSHGIGRHFARMRQRRRPGYGPNYYPYYDSGYYYPYDSDYYPDYDAQDETSETPPPPFRAQTAAATPPANQAKPPESLVMELRGDHWVRLTSYGPMEVAGQSGEPQLARVGGPTQAKGAVASGGAQAPSELPPAVLVFRDGHQEEVAKYTIVGTTISVKTDYWSTGSWTRKISIADLNLAATLQANQERGAKFSLPSRPSEVIVR
jgi:hypothetical protein